MHRLHVYLHVPVYFSEYRNMILTISGPLICSRIRGHTHASSSSQHGSTQTGSTCSVVQAVRLLALRFSPVVWIPQCDKVEVLFPSSSRFLRGRPSSSCSGLPEGLLSRVWSQSERREAQQSPCNNGLSSQGGRVTISWHHSAAHKCSTHSRDCKSPIPFRI